MLPWFEFSTGTTPKSLVLFLTSLNTSKMFNLLFFVTLLPKNLFVAISLQVPSGPRQDTVRLVSSDKHEEIKAGIENGSLRPVGDKYPGWYFDVKQLINSPSTTYYQVKTTTGEVINDGTRKHPKETKVKRSLLSVKRKFDRLTKKAGKRKKRKRKTSKYK